MRLQHNEWSDDEEQHDANAQLERWPGRMFWTVVGAIVLFVIAGIAWCASQGVVA